MLGVSKRDTKSRLIELQLLGWHHVTHVKNETLSSPSGWSLWNAVDVPVNTTLKLMLMSDWILGEWLNSLAIFKKVALCAMKYSQLALVLTCLVKSYLAVNSSFNRWFNSERILKESWKNVEVNNKNTETYSVILTSIVKSYLAVNSSFSRWFDFLIMVSLLQNLKSSQYNNIKT